MIESNNQICYLAFFLYFNDNEPQPTTIKIRNFSLAFFLFPDPGSAKLGWARRNLRGCSYKLRETAYTTLIRPGLEYCDSIWDPHTKADAALLDQVQNRASRWAKGKSKYEACSVTALQRELGWLPLTERRRHHRLSILYKIRNGLLAVEPEAIDLVPNSRPGKQSQYKRPAARNSGSPIWHQFVFRTVQEWNVSYVSRVNAQSMATGNSVKNDFMHGVATLSYLFHNADERTKLWILPVNSPLCEPEKGYIGIISCHSTV